MTQLKHYPRVIVLEKSVYYEMKNRTTSILAGTDMLLMKITTSDLDKMSTTLQAQFYKAVAHSMVKRLSDHKTAADKAA